MNPEEEILKKMDEVIDSGLYKPEWDSLMENKAMQRQRGCRLSRIKACRYYI